MKGLKRAVALAAAVCVLAGGSAMGAAPATPTPAPVAITTQVQTPPQQIQDLLDLAYHEWETLGGKTLKQVNKYTEWRGKGVGFGWCGGFITWLMLQENVPMAELEEIPEAEVDGVVHVKEASVGKLLRGYQKMNRTTRVPQPGYLLVYGAEDYQKTLHVGLVYAVEELGGGRYRLTTIEGNMSNRVKMYVHDYNMYAEPWNTNLSLVPEKERTQKETSYFNYKIQGKKWHVNCFLMPWVPDMPDPTPTPVPTPSPVPTVTPEPEEDISIFDL